MIRGKMVYGFQLTDRVIEVFRALRNRPFQFLFFVCILGSGLGLNLACLSLLDSILFRGIGVPGEQDLKVLHRTSADGVGIFGWKSYSNAAAHPGLAAVSNVSKEEEISLGAVKQIARVELV